MISEPSRNMEVMILRTYVCLIPDYTGVLPGAGERVRHSNPGVVLLLPSLELVGSL